MHQGYLEALPSASAPCCVLCHGALCVSTELLRKSAEHTLVDMVQLLFSRWVPLTYLLNLFPPLDNPNLPKCTEAIMGEAGAAWTFLT